MADVRVDPIGIRLLDALEHDRFDMIKYYINNNRSLLNANLLAERFPSAPPTTPLHAAASLGNDVAVAWLLQQDGILVDGPEPNKSTPLHMAVEAKFLTCAQLLIEKKANVNTSDKDGITPMHTAVRTNSMVMVDILHDAKAEIYIRNKDGETPLQAARASGHAMIVKLLQSMEDEKYKIEESDKLSESLTRCCDVVCPMM